MSFTCGAGRAPPGAEELDAADVEEALGRDADARAVAVGRALDDAVAHEHAARSPRLPVEEVAVDADHGRVGESRFCIDVTRSRPWIASFERTGRSAYRPVGLGPDDVERTGPCDVN